MQHEWPPNAGCHAGGGACAGFADSVRDTVLESEIVLPEGKLREGTRIRDAQGRVHEVGRMTRVDGQYLLRTGRNALHFERRMKEPSTNNRPPAAV